jgi:Na+-driven multidrug efflux pump
MMANVTGNCVGMGFCMALDTLCSNAFGAQKYQLVGLQTQRVMVILTFMCVPIGLVWSQTEAILNVIGLNKYAVAYSPVYFCLFICSRVDLSFYLFIYLFVYAIIIFSIEFLVIF